MHRIRLLCAGLMVVSLACHPVVGAGEEARAPFKYLWGKAYHVLPGTHNEESGYFSLCEGRNGRIYVGTASYGVNAHLVEFDPAAETQRIAIDTHKVCGLSATGYAAQAKIHTRNFVGPSGKIYVGSKQGYRRGAGDTAEYPGGYVMVHDPASRKTTNLGMPYPGQGVIDVAADETNGLIYVVTCEDQHWMLYDTAKEKYRKLGPILTPYATTIVDFRGRANAITMDFQLARYDPATGKITVRDIIAGGRKLGKGDLVSGPVTWDLAPDGKTAYLIRMAEPSLFRMDLAGDGADVTAVNLGRMIEGKGCDSRGALSIGPDGRVYAAIRVDNETGFGSGYLHHIVRYDPGKNAMEDLGVPAVTNPDFFDFGPGPDGKPKPWSHGYQKLPDGTLVPLHHHMAMRVAHDGTIYMTILYPMTLLRIPAVK